MAYRNTMNSSPHQTHRLDTGRVNRSGQGWPTDDAATVRVGFHRLPAVAEVVKITPAEMTQHRLPDGRVEQRTQKSNPPDDSSPVRMRYRESR